MDDQVSIIDRLFKNMARQGWPYLDLSGVNVPELPPSVGGLITLNDLNVSSAKLEKVSEAIGKLSQLKILNLSRNYLTEIPGSIGQLRNLERLDLSQNWLTKLPESIGNLQNLHYLDVSNNRITSLPESIGQLQTLRTLIVSNNQLKSLPDSIRNLGSLSELSIRGNTDLGIPDEVLGSSNYAYETFSGNRATPERVIEYYFRLKRGQLPLNEAKFILVGRAGVGKTSTVNRLVFNRFSTQERRTEGIQITNWRVRLNEDEFARLNIWDFGGQEIMHSTHQFFLTQRSLYLLVLTGREGLEDSDADYWLKLISSFGGESPVLVVLNKIKLHPFDVNRRGLQQKYPIIRGFIQTDCEDGTGFQELRKAIERETSQLEHLRVPFPASWFNIKDKLAGMKKNYLRFEEYRELCSNLGEKDTSSQDALAFYLHNLGIILNYKDDPRLLDTHILNPHWVTNGIYTILNSEKVERQKGEVRLGEIGTILDQVSYPIGMRRFIFDLMKKFELCFTYPDDDTHYLIPELLDKQEPPEVGEFNPAECLNFQYHYPILPEGLLPRFIVRTHALSEGLPRWRTGVILKFSGNKALVKADVQDKKVFIYVSGPAEGRNRLLAVIRSDFERIHHDIGKLDAQQMVSVPEHPDLVVPYQKLQVLEQQGIETFSEVDNDSAVEVRVNEVLRAVDITRARKTENATDPASRPLKLFYSYSHVDDRLRYELETHLKLLQRQGLIAAWYDRKIEAGEDWKQRIDENLQNADLVILLVSADFIASDYCYEREMKMALERHESKEMRVIPVLIRDVNWKIAPFAKLQALPTNGVPVSKWTDRDSAWRNVSEGIESIVEELRKRKLDFKSLEQSLAVSRLEIMGSSHNW